jgi:L-fuconolactonase
VKITDCQIHDVGPFWDWLGESPDVQHRVMGELVLAYLDAVGVDRVVLFCGSDFTLAGSIARSVPDRVAFVPQVVGDQPDIDAAIAAAKARHGEGQLGVRVQISWPMDGSEVRRLETGGWDPVFAACEKHQVPLFMLVTGYLPMVAQIMARYPKLILVIDHIGMRQPPMDDTDDPPFARLQELLDLARFPTVYIKLCGLPAMSKEPYPYRDTHGALRRIVDAFGADRLMWGSDTTRFVGRVSLHRFAHPRTLQDYPGKHHYADALFYIRESEVLSEEEKRAILSGTLERVLRWP